MPNHITNRIQLSGDAEQIKSLMQFIKGDNLECKVIDFNTIEPMPKELDIKSDQWLMPIENEFSSRTQFKSHLDEMREVFFKNPDREEEDTENFIQGIRNYIKYGHATWYNWSINNWGTKWNAYSQELKEDGTIMFETAWSGVSGLISKLSSKFPMVRINYAFADEDIGCNAGIGEFYNGTSTFKMLENESKEAYELAFELMPDNKEYYNLVDGQYVYAEEE